ncbi:MAG: YbjN domain-containing protein [Acidimicrobiales bacterium]
MADAVTAEGGTPRALSEVELDEVEAQIDAWAQRQLGEGGSDRAGMVAAVDRGEPGERRWFVRVRGEAKDVFTIWFTLRQRTLAYETYVMPAPEENAERLYEFVLRRNPSMFGAAYAIGEEDAVFLAGQFPAAAVTDTELDRILGSMWAWVERDFGPMLRIGFASRFGKVR